MSVVPHLGDGGRANARFGTQVFLLHILVDKQLSELFITDRHNIVPPYRYAKNALPPGRAFLLNRTAEAYPNTDSVVIHVIRFWRKKQENNVIARLLLLWKLVYISLAQEAQN